MSKLKVGVIGLGHNGLAWCQAYKGHALTELVAVCDIDESRREQVSRELGVDAYGDDSIYERADIDVLSVHTSDDTHVLPFVKALENGKHCFVEKPMANSIADLKTMLAAARASDRRTMVGQVLRFNPLFALAHKFCEDGVFGEIFYMEADYIHDLRYQQYMEPWKITREIPIVGGGVHPLDLLRWYAGDIEEVVGFSNHIAYQEMQADTTQAALFKFRSGAVAKVSALYGPIGPMGHNYNLAIYRTKGTLKGNKLSLDGLHDFMEIPIHTAGHPYEPEIDYFADCILHDKPCMIDAEEGAKSAQACLLADMSAKAGGARLKVEPL